MRQIPVTFLVLSTMLFASACGGNDDGGTKNNVVSVKGTEYAFAVPDTVKGGVVTMRVSNIGREFHEYALGRLKEGKTFSDFEKELASGEDPSSSDDIAGVPILSPGKEVTITRKLEPGNYVFLCGVPTAKGVPHFKLGMIKPFEVAGTSTADLPKPDATVTAREKAMAVPAMEAGEQTLELRNGASKPREFELLSLKPGKTFDEVKAMFEGDRPPSPKDAPATFLGAMQSIPPGSSVFLNVKLEAGKTYLFLDAENRLMKEFTVG
jgi:uncharacterized cupredoxin-like copper-binding protein